MGDLGERDFRFHDLPTTTYRFDAFGDAPLLLKVTHDVAGESFGHHDLQFPHRFENVHPGFVDGLFDRVGTRELERHVRRVDGVVLAVEELDLDVDHRVSGTDAVLHRSTDALLDRGDPLVRDRATEDRIDELEAFTARDGLDAHAADPVL